MNLGLGRGLGLRLGLGKEILYVDLALTVDHLPSLLVINMNIIMVIVVVLIVVVVILAVVVVVVAEQGTAVTGHPSQEFHLSGKGLQLAPELPVLLLELDHSPTQRPAQVGSLLQPALHAQLESTDVHVDLPDGVPESVLVTCESHAHRLPLQRRRRGGTQISHLSQGRSFHFCCCYSE